MSSKKTQVNTSTSRRSEKHNIDYIKDALGIIRVDWIYVLTIFLGIFLMTAFYAITSKNIYSSTTIIKITKPQGSILTSSPIPEFNDFGFISDRYISNEIEVLKSFSIRNIAAQSLLDSAEAINDPTKFYYLLEDPDYPAKGFVDRFQVTNVLRDIVKIFQKKGLDVVELSVESPSNFEASLICNTYAASYADYSLEFSRQDLTNIINYLSKEKEIRFVDLKNSEASLEDFQKREGLVRLDVQSEELVRSISELDKEQSLARVQLVANTSKYSELTKELEKIDPQMPVYLESQINLGYVTEVQKQIAEMEMKRDIKLTIPGNERIRSKAVEDYERKIKSLNDLLNERLVSLNSALYGMTPEYRRELVTEIVKTGIERNSFKIKDDIVTRLLNNYERTFEQLPSQIIEFARLERAKLASEKIYMLLEEKYQEALINQNARIGNVNIIDPAFVPVLPSKPNRIFLLISGGIFGIVAGVGFVLLKNYFDKTVKTPEELEKAGMSVLAWVPTIDVKDRDDISTVSEFIVAFNPKSSISESFKVLRTRVQYAKIEEEPLKTILVTSSIPGEGKTTVAINLAGSFALDGKKVILIDCDLRKPRVHSVMHEDRYPGLTDYLFGNVQLENIVRKTIIDKMDFITSGTIPPNPSELLGSVQLKKFLDKLKEEYDIIVLDSPPSISVTDSEILFKITDGTILVVQSMKTPIEALIKVYERFENLSSHNLLGTVLNNFSFKRNYGYYYNYYYYYSVGDKSK